MLNLNDDLFNSKVRQGLTQQVQNNVSDHKQTIIIIKADEGTENVCFTIPGF